MSVGSDTSAARLAQNSGVRIFTEISGDSEEKEKLKGSEENWKKNQQELRLISCGKMSQMVESKITPRCENAKISTQRLKNTQTMKVIIFKIKTSFRKYFMRMREIIYMNTHTHTYIQENI